MTEDAEPVVEQEYLSPIIEDGWTFKATIPGVPGLASPIEMRYRPISPDEESEVFAKSRLDPSQPMTAFYGPLMAKKIRGWDVRRKNDKGQWEKVPITEDVLRHKIHPLQYDAIKQYVDGNAVGEIEKN